MKKLISIVFIAVLTLSLTAGAQKPPMGPDAATQLAQQKVIKEKAYKLLDSFVGDYEGKAEIEGKTYTASLVIKPKYVNDLYYPAHYKLIDAEGKVYYESAMMLAFNSGGMSYFFFFFSSDEYIKTSFGQFKEGEIALNSPIPGGMEFLRYTKPDENTLKFEKWNPSNSQTQPETEADLIIEFKKK